MAGKTAGLALAAVVIWVGSAISAAAIEAGVWSFGNDPGEPFYSGPDIPTAGVVTLDGVSATVSFVPTVNDAMISVGGFSSLYYSPRLKLSVRFDDDTLEIGELVTADSIDDEESDTTSYFVLLPVEYLEWLMAGDELFAETDNQRAHLPLTGSRYSISQVIELSEWNIPGAAVFGTAGSGSSQSDYHEETWDEECLRLAGHPSDANSNVEGVDWNDIDTLAAAEACNGAIDNGFRSPQVHYLMGRVLDKVGDAESVMFLEMAADAGYPIAFAHLGILAWDGDYGPKDLGAARDYFEQGAELGDISSRYNLGRLNVLTGSTHQQFLGMRTVKKLADGGFPIAQYQFAKWLADGRATGQNEPASARPYFAKSADNGNRNAAYELAKDYRDGTGGAVNPQLYLEYLRLAASLGHEGAREELGVE